MNLRILLLILTLFILETPTIMAQSSDPNLQEKYHQFDFWIGKWDVYKLDTETISGKSEIESIIDSIGILENYATVDGKYSGKSLNKYNPAKERWEQYWIDNSGLTLYLVGGIVDGKMILDDLQTGDPKNGFNQIIWQLLPNGDVQQTWNISTDNGQTWKTVFDGIYKKRKN